MSSGFVYAYFKPFVEKEDDLVSSIAQYQIFFVLLAALMSLINSSDYVGEGGEIESGDLYSDVLFGWLLVIVSLIGPGIATALLLRERLMTVRDKVRELLGLRQDTAANAAEESEENGAPGEQEAAIIEFPVELPVQFCDDLPDEPERADLPDAPERADDRDGGKDAATAADNAMPDSDNIATGNDVGEVRLVEDPSEAPGCMPASCLPALG